MRPAEHEPGSRQMLKSQTHGQPSNSARSISNQARPAVIELFPIRIAAAVSTERPGASPPLHFNRGLTKIRNSLPERTERGSPIQAHLTAVDQGSTCPAAEQAVDKEQFGMRGRG